MMERYDLVIIGGGPSGSSLARCLPKGFGRVLLLDKRDLNTDAVEAKKKPCSGLVSLPAQRELKLQGLEIPEWVFAHPRQMGVQVTDASTGRSVVEKDVIFNVDRGLFDKWLFSLIPNHVETINDGKMISYSEENDLVTLKYESRGEQFEVETKVLVGADGANSIVRMGLESADKIPKYTGIEWFVEGNVQADKPMFHIIIDEELTDYYVWALPKNGELHVGGAFSAISNSGMIPERLEATLQKLKVLPRDYRIVQKWAHPISRAKRLDNLNSGRDPIYLIGEASGLICPTSAEGYSYALGSARQLASQLSGTQSEQPSFDGKALVANKLRKRSLIYNSFIRKTFFRVAGQRI